MPLLSSLALLVALTGDPPIGASVGDLRFVDTRYLERSLSDFGTPKATVLVFTTVACPLVQRYLPRLGELERRLRARGVQFVAVNVGPGDQLIDVARQGVESEVEFPFVKDFEGALVAALGVERTPEVVVLDAARTLRYRGRIDAQYRVGGANPTPGRGDLELAIEDVLAGRPVALSETAVDGCVIEPLPAPAPRTDLTWSREIAALVQRACQDCHHEGSVAPFALVAHRDVARRAAMVAEVVRLGRMPPWFAAPGVGELENAPRITEEEREMLVGWVLAGAPEGDPARAPRERVFERSTWRIGEPDLVIRQGVASKVPADGYVPYQYVILPHVFLDDTWVEAVEVRPENARVVHHANLAHVRLTEQFETRNFITGFVPGGDPLECDPGTAVLIPKGSLLALQVHVVTTGREETSTLSVALRFPRTTVERRLRHEQIHNSRFEIPPLAPAHPVRAKRVLEHDSTGIGMFVHMHLRGRDMAFRATYPDGRAESLLLVPNFNFDWQQSYRWAPGSRHFPAGTRIDVLAHFDNSRFNPYNPDPTASVRFGQQTEDEMMYGFLFYTEDQERLGLRVDAQSGRVLER